MTLPDVRQRVAEAAHQSGRDAEEVTLVAVSKGWAPTQIMDAYGLGQRDFGESRAQELVQKAGRLPADIRWHFVGPLQRNKAARVRREVVMLHSLDRSELAIAWAKGPGPPPPVLVEVNVGGEAQKTGVEPYRAEELIAQALDLGLEVKGLMTIPPRVAEQARPYFEQLRLLRDRLAVRWPEVQELSMGMTEDFQVAIRAGSTMVRVGRAIFDPSEHGESSG